MDSPSLRVSPTTQDTGISASAPVRLLRFTGTRHKATDDIVSVEEPLQIRLAGEDVAITMRTPGHDEELAAGFLFTEGVISGAGDIDYIGHCPDNTGELSPNVVNLLPQDRELLRPRAWGRNFYATSSCGLCGKTSIEQVRMRSNCLSGDLRITPATIYGMAEKLGSAQQAFQQTGGLHAAALFNREAEILLVREDVGRHNAVDKVIGRALLDDMLPLNNHILVVSSRASFEIVQKALSAGINILAVFSAPSSLAVEMAREAGMTLIAFLREGRMNVYSGEERIRQNTGD